LSWVVSLPASERWTATVRHEGTTTRDRREEEDGTDARAVDPGAERPAPTLAGDSSPNPGR
jgi:hypothetical protein